MKTMPIKTTARHLRRALLLGALLVALGCGSTAVHPDGSTDGAGGDTAGNGDGAAADTAAAINCGDPTFVIDPTALIDDMEATDPTTKMGAARGGSWWAGGDDPSKLTGAAIVPDGPATAEPIAGGRCGSHYAEHVTGHGFGSWSVINVSFGWDSATMLLLPYDASFRSGITFWARIGDTSTDQVRLNVTDKYSNDNGGICDKTVASGPTACYDHFGVSLTQLSTDWHQYKVPFLGLTQQNFGIPRPGVDTTALYSIDFNFPVGSVFDLWIDDISFY